MILYCIVVFLFVLNNSTFRTVHTHPTCTCTVYINKISPYSNSNYCLTTVVFNWQVHNYCQNYCWTTVVWKWNYSVLTVQYYWHTYTHPLYVHVYNSTHVQPCMYMCITVHTPYICIAVFKQFDFYFCYWQWITYVVVRFL